MASFANPTRDDFAKLLDEQLGGVADDGFEGRVVKGTITAIENDKAVIDVGLKSEGRVPLREFARGEGEHGLKVGDEVEVYVDRVENADGEAMLSRDRARREAAWDKLESEFGEGKRVEGVILMSGASVVSASSRLPLIARLSARRAVAVSRSGPAIAAR